MHGVATSIIISKTQKSTTMKKILFITAVSCFLLTSCSKAIHKNAFVVRDCTGTYLRIEGKDYHVCNLEKVRGIPDGTAVAVSYKKLDECHGSAKEEIVCMLLRASEGWIEVKDINQ